MKLYGIKNDFGTQKIICAASFAEIKINFVEHTAPLKNFHAESVKHLASFPITDVPFLETDDAVICGVVPILMHLGRMSPQLNFYGKSITEASLVDQWITFICANISWPMKMMNDSNKELFVAKIKAALKCIDEHLLHNTYMVGEQITIADISMCITLTKLMECPYAATMFQDHISLDRFFKTMTSMPKIKAVVKIPIPAAAAEKSSAQNTEEAAEAKPVKKPNEFDLLPPTPMVMDTWKKVYCNTPVNERLEWLWKNFDANGYCFYKLKFIKEEGDCRIQFVTCNQLTGFIQRIDPVLQKNMLGIFMVLGKPGDFNIEALCMFRGTQIPELFKDHPLFDCYEVTPLDIKNQTDKSYIEQILSITKTPNNEIIGDAPLVNVYFSK